MTAKKTALPKKRMTFVERKLAKGLGEAVAKRTYLRTDKDGKLEPWSEVAERVALGNVSLLPEKLKKEKKAEYEILRKHIANASLLMSGRHLQHGDKNQAGRNMEVFTNCFDGETKILTLEHGPVEFKKIVNKKVTVKTRDGEWRQTQVNSYGKQEVFNYKFGAVNGNLDQYLLEANATENHRWFLSNNKVTENLKVGDFLEGIDGTKIIQDDEAICHGLIFGDGTGHQSRDDYGKGDRKASQGRTYASIRLCGEDKKYLDYFKEYTVSFPPHAKGDPVVYLGKKPMWKEVPFTHDQEYIAGFIYGWWLADGSKTYNRAGGIEISTTNELAVAWLKDYAAFGGYIVTGITVRERKSGDGSYANGKKLYSVRLNNKGIRRKVLSKTSLGTKEVYCVEEPVTTSFVLANGLLTGNCSTAASSFILFYLLLNGSGVGRSYDDDLMVVNWDNMPIVRCVLDENHPDFIWGDDESVRDAQHKYAKAYWFEVPDTREGWAEAVEKIETMAYEGKYKDDLLIIDFSKVRAKGSPIGGMQNRPASGPRPLIKSIQKLTTVKNAGLEPWRQTMFVDHYLSECVLVGGARRAARIATKVWTDSGIFDFISIKRGGFLWSANNSVAVDEKFWKQKTKHSQKVLEAVLKASYYDKTGEPGFVNQHRLVQNDEGFDGYLNGQYARSDRYRPAKKTEKMMAVIAKKANAKYYTQIPNPCGEITLNMLGGYCVIADVVPYYAPDTDAAEEAFRAATRALMRVNLMDSLYNREVKRTNRIGVGMTGVHEYAWNAFGYSFRDLINEKKSQDFWDVIARYKRAVADESVSYAKKLGVNVPHTNTTIKPSGTVSKLFALSEGAHLPAMREYIRWVQFRSDDPVIKKYKKQGYPIKELKSYQGTTAVGFPTQPEICRLGMNGELVTASEATPEEQYKWLMLLEKYWINGVDENGKPLEDTGNQVSYTLKYDPEHVSFKKFSNMVKKYQPLIKTCSVMPKIDTTAYEYQPEEPVTSSEFMRVITEISANGDKEILEDVSLEQLKCDTGACPI